MKKVDGRIEMITELEPGNSVLVAEDVVTRGTATREAIASIFRQQPGAIVMPWVVAIINRGRLESVIADTSKFLICAIADTPMDDWPPDKCPLCPKSIAIKPKESDESWRRITHSQI